MLFHRTEAGSDLDGSRLRLVYSIYGTCHTSFLGLYESDDLQISPSAGSGGTKSIHGEIFMRVAE